MKRLLVLVGCAVFLSGFAGCQNAGQTAGETIEKDSSFPQFLVGVWEADIGNTVTKWGIKFERDGSILKIVHPVAGPIKLEEGGFYEEGPDENTYCFFVMDLCEANYAPNTRMLKVKIIVDDFHMKLPAGDLEGRMEDYLDGHISKDGRTWRADWLNYTWLKGADPPPLDIIKANPVPLVFTKIDIK